jgi:hypothetical protein
MKNESTLPLAERIRRNLYAIEALELGGLAALGGLAIGLLAGTPVKPNEVNQFWSGLGVITTLVPMAALFLWGVYLLYIRLARAGGGVVDVGLWILMAAITSSFTFWCWTVLDINRFIIAKLFYRGEAPVEYAWSARSKRRRREWAQAKKAAMAQKQAMGMGEFTKKYS